MKDYSFTPEVGSQLSGRVLNWCLSGVTQWSPSRNRTQWWDTLSEALSIIWIFEHLAPIFGEWHTEESVCIGLMRHLWQGKFKLEILKGIYRTSEYNKIKNTVWWMKNSDFLKCCFYPLLELCLEASFWIVAFERIRI